MGVTLSRAAERKTESPRTRRSGAPELPGIRRESRRREAALLGLSGIVVLLALLLTWGTVHRSLADGQEKLDHGELLNLNVASRAGDLLPLLSFLDTSEDRSFVAARIRERLNQGQVDNVGELGRLRVSAREIDARRMNGLAARFAASNRDSLPLLSPAELRQLKPRLVVRSPRQFRSIFLLGAGLLLLSFFLAHVILRWRDFPGDELFLPVILLLCGLGFCLMTSLRDPLRDLPLNFRFAQGVLAGCALFVLGALVDLERTFLPRRGVWALALAALLSGLLIGFGGGPGGSDAKVNFLGFQPVELIKILIALFLASYFADRWELLREVPEKRLPLGPAERFLRLPRLEYALPPIVAIGLVLFFFFLQRDLGPALVLASLFLILFSVARGRPGLAVLGAAAVALACFAGYQLGYPRTVGQRIGMWLSPWDTWFHGGDHLAQAIWSIATGGATGTGLGLGEPGLVPEAHTDMIFSALGEELGFCGLLAVAVLYALLAQRGLRATRRAGTPYGFFLGLGLTLLLALETALIAGGVLRLLPLSGVASPFLSFGRSAMLANFLLCGLLAGLSARTPRPETVRPFLGGARWVGIGLGAFALLAVFRLAELQLFFPDFYLTRGAITLQGDGVRRFQYNPRLAAIAATIPRGSIVDRNGVLLATSDPGELAAHRAELQKLGATELDGATPDRRTRVYPFGGRTFHLLGDLRTRLNWAATNTSFAERDSRVRLQGYDDYAGVVKVTQIDGSSAPVVVVDYRELVPLLRHRYQPDDPEVKRILGRDRTVRLAIDLRLELAAQDILKKYVAQAGSTGAPAQPGEGGPLGAAAVVLDADSGDVLASASYPFPDRLPAAAEVSIVSVAQETGTLLDRARYGRYPPGSTFKVVTALAALRKDPALAGKTFECKLLPNGRVGNRVRGRLIHDDPTVTSPHGTVDMGEGIRHSCNAYFAQLATYSLGAGPLAETAKLFSIPVARPNTPKQLDEALPQAAYGQGQVIATPFQMARVAATVAAAGRMPEGRWILGGDNPRTGSPVQILDPQGTAIVARAMRGVVTSGTAAAFLANVAPPIAGKTGTAEVQNQKSHSWFIGYAPHGTAGRRIAFAVIVEHGGYGGRLAAPAAGEIVRRAAALGLLTPQPPPAAPTQEGRTNP
ncbi:MAG TPA: FtsW/RodA/SpoVE family cell cycle protein [Thermoanaerobaculia bacterium]|nr:FtsW/RodA/SpoVE family cell cycle protein [Thermoanaerobaculia bacterium]